MAEMEDVLRKMASTAPRDSRQPGCPEWCYQTLNLLAMGWQSYEIEVDRLTEYYESICVFKAWEKIPVQKPYGSKEALLKAELGIDDDDFYKALAKKVTARDIRRERDSRISEMVDSGEPHQKVADLFGITKQRVGQISKENSVMTPKTLQEPRKRTVIQLSHYTKPTTAAQKIRATFGDEFAHQLAEALTHEI